MVNMIFTFLLALSSFPVAASAYKLEPSTIALGEPATLTMTAKSGSLDKLDLTPLSKDFEIHSRSLGGDGKEENLVLTLYPLHTGRIVLPDMGLRGRPPVVTVNDESDTTPKLRFRFETDPEQYHVRQSLRLTIEACDDGSLMWQRPQLATQQGLFMRPINEEQADVERDGERCTAHRWHWAVLPTVAGNINLPLPMLEANKFGQRLRFPPPPVQLTALPVPAWLPADVAIGKPEVIIPSLPSAWPVERPMTWKFEVKGSYSVEALKNLLRLQLSSQPQFGDYAPSVEESGIDNGVPRYAISLYPLFRESGEIRLPDLALPWYDPATEILQRLEVTGSRVQVFDPAMQRLMNWLIGIGAVMSVFATGYLLWRMLGWRLRRRRALAGLESVEDIDRLAKVLCAFSLKARTRPATTLGDWQQRMLKETETQGLSELVGTVEAARYGNVQTEFGRVLSQARQCLATARPKS